jgi:hypothetical protein
MDNATRRALEELANVVGAQAVNLALLRGQLAEADARITEMMTDKEEAPDVAGS